MLDPEVFTLSEGGALPFTGRYVFIGGLHRTGTSLLAGLLSSAPDIAAIEGSPAPENEGCYLQGAIPHTARHGRPCHFATDPAQYFVEGCQYDTLATRQRIEADWVRWFQPASAAWRLEKSPVNLTRMRLYQQLFPMAQFIVILRHPAAMAAALEKWVDGPASDRIEHALDAYESLYRDLPYLHAVSVIRYEDLTAHPHRTLAMLFAFLDVPMPDITGAVATLRDGNAEYRDAWEPTPDQAARAMQFGYVKGLGVHAWEPVLRHPLRQVRDAMHSAWHS